MAVTDLSIYSRAQATGVLASALFVGTSCHCKKLTFRWQHRRLLLRDAQLENPIKPSRQDHALHPPPQQFPQHHDPAHHRHSVQFLGSSVLRTH